VKCPKCQAGNVNSTSLYRGCGWSLRTEAIYSRCQNWITLGRELCVESDQPVTLRKLSNHSALPHLSLFTNLPCLPPPAT
jgi:hypothetical protein